MPAPPPSPLCSRPADYPFEAVLEAEFLAEAAAIHGRLLEKLERALDAYREAKDRAPEMAAERLDRAGRALWYIAIQRELMGIGGLDGLLAELDVPAPVRFKAGI